MDHFPKRNERRKRALWMPASTYYFLSCATSIGIFFLVWAILNESGEDSPWIPAGLIGSGMLIGAGAVREIILRGRRSKMLAAQRRLDRTLLSVPVLRIPTNPDKLTLERNALFLNEIKRKSDAAKVLSSIPASHREVFELCEEYLDLIDRELPLVGAGSPRMVPLLKGRGFASRFHKYHMLRWAEGEARNFAQAASKDTGTGARLEIAATALSAIESAAQRYPGEPKLEESGVVIQQLMASIRASELIEQAKNLRFRGEPEGSASMLDEAEAVIGEAEALRGEPHAVFERLLDEVRDLRNGDGDLGEFE